MTNGRSETANFSCIYAYGDCMFSVDKKYGFCQFGAVMQQVLWIYKQAIFLFLFCAKKIGATEGTGCFTNNVTNSKRNISRNNACISTKISLYNRKIIPNNILNS